MSEQKKLVISFLIILVLIPAVIIGAFTVFGAESYPAVCMVCAALACVPFIVGFERNRNDARRLMLVAVMTALSVIGRLAFMATQFIKPVAAFAIFAGMYLGASSGFVTGSLSAVVSNIYFGQGAWTPFQMLAWGLVGFFAGVFSKRLDRSPVLLSVYGAIAGVVYSLILDLWSTMWASGGPLDIHFFLVSISTSMPFTITYAVSNIIFLLLLKRPIGSALSRLEVKYGL